MIGLPQHELLGRNIFEFIEDGEVLRQKVAEYCRGGRGVEEGNHPQRLIHVSGRRTEVETRMLLASKTDHHPRFTVLFKPRET